MTASKTLLARADDFTPARFSTVMIPAMSARPHDVRNLRHVTLVQRRCNPHRIDQRLQQIIQDHCPARQKSQMRVQSLSDVGVGRSRGRIQRAHASVADRRDQHGEQSDQNDGDKVAVGKFLRHAIQWNRRDGLDENDAVENQVPKRERAAKPRRGRGAAESSFHGSGYWIMEGAKLSILKRFYSRATAIGVYLLSP